MRTAKNFAGFSDDLDEFLKHVDVNIALVRKKAAFDLFGRVVDRTPVDTGRLRMSWAMADGVPPQVEGPEGGTNGDADGAAAAAQANIAAQFHSPFDITWITNALPYAERIEFGYSQKAPAGMARVSVAETELELKAAFGQI